jgi:hypothetical protein
MAQGDDHIRLLKSSIQATFPNIDGAVTATQEKLNNGAVPTGTIVLWYSTSASIPTGWTYCNGVQVAKMDGSGNITPLDLRDRFVVGAGTTYAQGATGGSTTSSSDGAHTHGAATGAGGDHTHGGSTGSTTLTTSQIPAHTHNTGTIKMVASKDFSGSGNYDVLLDSGETNGSGTDTGYTTGSAGTGGSHNHTISASGTHTHSISSDGAHTHTVTPPYYAVVYMMRK